MTDTTQQYATGAHAAAVEQFPVPTEELHVQRLRKETMMVPIVGITPLIVHRWDEKMKASLPGGAESAKGGRTKKVHPTAEEAYESSRYRLPDGSDGFPAVAFKAAMVDSYHLFDGLTKKFLKTMIFVTGIGPDQLVPIDGEPRMREDVVRIGQGSSNLRHRAMYEKWSTALSITYLPNHVAKETILALVDAAGLGGVGEWRPSAPKSSTGIYGQFQLAEG